MVVGAAPADGAADRTAPHAQSPAAVTFTQRRQVLQIVTSTERSDTCQPVLRRQLDRIAVGTFTGPAGTFRQRTQISPAQAAILEQLGISPPPKIYQLTPAATG
jgi:hypothetical protein